MDGDEEQLNRHVRQLERELPPAVGQFMRWLREPSARWVRVPLGIFLILAGIFSFLPVLGLWMLPLGLLLLAQDVPVLRRPTGRALVWLERRWLKGQNRRRGDQR